LGFWGSGFKAGTDDLRESPVIEVIERLQGKGYDLRIFDKNVRIASLVGANRSTDLRISRAKMLNTTAFARKDIQHQSNTCVLQDRLHKSIPLLFNWLEPFASTMRGGYDYWRTMLSLPGGAPRL
jgi:hypothetical protein